MRHRGPKENMLRKRKGREFNIYQVRLDNGLKNRERKKRAEKKREEEDQREQRRDAYYQHFLGLYNERNARSGGMSV